MHLELQLIDTIDYNLIDKKRLLIKLEFLKIVLFKVQYSDLN